MSTTFGSLQVLQKIRPNPMPYLNTLLYRQTMRIRTIVDPLRLDDTRRAARRLRLRSPHACGAVLPSIKGVPSVICEAA